ncbi:hypothetical protein DRJ17_02840 [Candidatus Woesearchaeota archaeon]|nr:MAG: hypothetical protein DRJ17_02840 [Candidatus Woesearchaeota archaeon]
MDFEQIQKINALAKSLLQTGHADDLETATRMARDILEKGDKSLSEVTAMLEADKEKIQEYWQDDSIKQNKKQTNEDITEPAKEPIMAEVEELGDVESAKTLAKEGREEKATTSFDPDEFAKTLQTKLQAVINELVMEIKTLKDKVDVLNDDVAALKSKVIKVESTNSPEAEYNVPKEKTVAEKESKELKPDESKESKEQKSKEKKMPHPKVGDISSEDVSIEKYFYFGNK